MIVVIACNQDQFSTKANMNNNLYDFFSTQDHLDTLPLSADRVRELRAGFYSTVLNLLSFSLWKKF